MAYKKLDDERYAKLVDAVNKLPSTNATTNLSRTKPTSSAPNMPSFTPNHRDLDSIQTDLTAAKRERSGLLNDFGFEPVDLSQYRVKLDTANQNVNRYKSEKLIEDKVYQTGARADTFGGQFSANKTMGRLTQNQSRAWNEYVKNPTPENRKTAESYDKAIKDFAEKNKIALDDENVRLGIISQSYANYLPQQVDQLKAQAPGAVIGGLAGLAVGNPVAGMKVGASITSGMDMYEITRGAAFKRFLDLGVDEETARTLATDEGIVQGLIEGGDTYLDWTLFGGKALATKLLPSLTAKASSAAGKTALAKVIKQLGGKVDNLPTAVKVAGAYGINIPQEGGEEGLQEIVSIANDQRAKTGETGVGSLIKSSIGVGKTLLSGGDIVTGRDQNYKPILASEQVKEAAKEGMKIAAVSGGMQAIGGYAAQRALTPKPAKADNKNTPAPVSPAASPEVQQVQAQAEVTKAQNPEAEVLDAATTLFTQQGMNLKTAQTRAEIVGKLVRGEEVSDKDLNKIDPTSNQTKQIFTQLTGVQFPEGKIQIEALRNLYRSAHTVAENARVESDLQRSLANANAMNAKFERNVSLAKQMEQSGYQTSPETQTRIDEENSKLANQVANLDIGPDGKPLASLSTFAEAYRSKIDPNATDKVVREKYAEFRNASRTILFGGHRLTKSQFTQLMRDHGKNLTDKQVNTLFNQAILDTLDGKDAFDRYTKKEDTGNKSSGGGIGTKQKEDSNDRKGQNQDSERDAQSRRAGDRTDRAESDDRGGRGSSERETGESGTGEKDVHEREKQPRLQGRKAQPLGLSGLKNPRTSKIKVPGIFGKVKAVDKADYTATMKAADEFVSSIGYRLIVTTDSFRTSLLEGFDTCDGLHDSENKIITVSAKETDSSDFYTTFMHEMFHVYVDKKNFQSKFLSKVCTYAKLPGANTRSEVYEFILGEALTNKYLSDYKRDFIRWGYTDEEIEFNIMDEMFAEIRSGSNANLALDEAVFDELESAAYTAWKEVAPAYTKALQHGVVRDKLKEAKTDGRTEQAYEGRSEVGDQRSQGKRRATQEGLRGADESAAGEHLRDGSLYRGDHQRTGESAGSVQEEGRRAEAGDGRGMETRNSSAGEVREREIETAHGLGTRAVGERGQSPRDSAESEALNIAVGKAEVPTFKSWNEAFLYFEHGAGQATGFSFGDPPMLADEMTLGTGKPWKAVKTYPITKEGLAQFQSDIPNLLSGDVGSAVDSVPDFVGKKHALTFAEKKKNAHKVTVDGHTYDAVSGADYTSAMHKIARQARKLGFRINFVYGDVHSSTGTCDGLTLPKTRQILVSVDSADYLKTARHEMFHARTAIDPGLHKTLLDRVREEGLLSEFRDAYGVFEGKWSNYNDLLLDAWTYQFKIENEVFAEACAKATGHHEGVKAFFDIVQEEVDRWDAEHGASHAGDTKPLGNPSLDTLREWYGDQLGEFDLNDLTDEYDDFLESYHIPDKLPHSAVDVDVLNDYLDQLVESRGADFARDISSAIQDLELSRRIAEVMSEIEASVGAAQSGFDPYSHLQNEYGTMEPGEKPARTVDLPKQTKDDNKVGQTPRTVMEAEATPESRIESIEQAVVDHKFSYKEGHNKIMVRRAEAAIRKNGWAESLTNWTRDVRDGKVNADLVAMGAVLLDNAGNSDMAGERYVQLVVDYHDLLHAAGQATQAARILKNLTPGARLYGLRGYAKNMTERIRKGDPAHNIPVEKWMEVTGNLLADRLRTKLNVPKKHAKTVSQTILSDLNAFAKTAFPEQEKTPGRTEMDRINDLFDNYEKYKEAWDAAKETIKKEYADMPEALEVFNNFLETDLADTFIGQYFGHPEIRISQALQQKFLSAKTDEERDAVTEEITKNIAQQIPATFMDKFTALRYLNMLGNFKTQIRNVTGNALNAGLTKGKNQVATLIELAVIKAGGKIERTKSFKKDPEVYRAALKDAEKMMDAILAGGKYEDGRRFDANIEKYRTIFKNKALEKYRKLTNEAMSRGDAVFSKIAYADALAGYLSAHGKTFETAGSELLDNARAYALKQAAEATFRDSNMFSDAIVAMRFRNPDTIAKKALNMIGEGILPFRKTPANILVRAVEYSPVGVITTMAETVYGKKTGTFNANKLIDSLAKNATGTMIFAVGALLSNLGLLKGKESDEDKEKEFDALTGHQAYSIELPNGMSLTLDWLAPSSVPLFLGAQFAENAADAGLSFRDVLTAMGAITDPMLQMSMLQGLDDALANASTYGDDSALVRFTGNALWSFLTQGLTNTMLGQLERSLTNERSTTYRDKHKDVPDGIQYLIGKTLEKVPLPGADYGQIPYIDAWGRIETNARTNFGNVLNQFFVPSYVSWVEESKMEKELRRLYEANTDENASVLISRPKSYFNVDNKRKDLTAEEFIEYATTRGQTAYNVATDLTESKIYGTLSDKQKAEAVLKAYDFANQMAKAVTTGYTPDKWDEDAPEGSVNPDNWVKEAMTCATEYGVPVGEYAAIYAATKDLESYKNSKGETVDNSKSLKVAVAIYDMGLSDAETKILLEAFGVNQTVRKYSDKTARAKLKAMKEKYE